MDVGADSDEGTLTPVGRVLYVATETRLSRGPDGHVRSSFSDTSYAAWAPYLAAFDRVVIVARVEDTVEDAPLDVEGPSISVLALPHYRGSRELIRQLPRLRAVVRRSLVDRSAVYAGRTPGVISTLLLARSRKLGAEFVAIVVGDPVEVARIGAAGPVLRAAAPLGGLILRWQLRHASRASYVTERVLQERYPVRAGAPQVSASNVRLAPDAFSPAPRDYTHRSVGQAWRLVTVGSQDATYKGHDVLLTAMAWLEAHSDLTLHLTVIGGGKHHDEYRALAESLGLEGSVEFTGHISDALELRERLRAADLFVFPSLTEGLPRALVEAMALALPCVATTVGGIPELLPRECLVPPRDALALARAIQSQLSRPERMNLGSRENLAAAHRIIDRVRDADLVSFISGTAEIVRGDQA